MTERLVPADAIAERATPTFTVESVPPALLNAHHTTVWAELVVTAGSVTFVEEDPPWATTLVAPGSIAIVPNRRHHVEPAADAEFHVQFFRLP